MFAIVLAATLLSGQDASSSSRSAADLTRDLNSGPPFKPAAPAQAPTPAQAPAAVPPPTLVPPTQVPSPPASSLTRDLNSAPPAAVGPAMRPTVTPVPAQAPAPAQVPARIPATSAAPVQVRPAPPALAPAPRQSPLPPASTPSPAPAAQGLDAAGIAGLPFTLDLPSGVSLTSSRAGADARIYAVRRGEAVLAMIYAGPASQFPIYDGQMVQAGGRASVVVTEGGRRLAMEHLFRRAEAPQDIHVWVAAPGGADRDLAERIAQSVDAR